MAKKFNKEERQAIISKLRRIAEQREQESWKEAREKYIPSETYKEVKTLLEQRAKACEQLRNINGNIFYCWAFQEDDSSYYLDKIRDSEIEHLVTRYCVNENDMDVEIILAGQEDPIDTIIENLLNQCVIK